MKTIDPVALAKASAAKRKANADKHARAVYQRIREYGEVTQNEAARRLNAEGFPKIRGKSEWGGTDIRNRLIRVSTIYGLDLDVADRRRLNDEADHYDNTQRAAQGKRALSYEEWCLVEAAPRPPLRITGVDDWELVKKRVETLREARGLLKEKLTGSIEDALTVPPSREENKDAQQLWNERLGLTLGLRKYHRDRLTQPLADSSIGNAIIKKFTPAFSEAVSKAIVMAVPDGTAAIILHQVLLEVAKEFSGRRHTLQRIAEDISKELSTEVTLQRMKREYPADYRRVERGIGAALPERKRRNLLIARAGAAIRVEFPIETGVALLAAVLSSGIIEKVRFGKKSDETETVQPTPALVKFIAEYDADHEDADQVHFPMIVKPTPWLGLVGGGFLTERRELVDTGSKEQRKALSDDPMPKVYQAINTLQATPFRINQRVLEVAEDLKIKEILTDLRAIEGETTTEAKKKRQKRQQVLEVAHRQMYLANRFKEEPEIYFIWEMDFRGRMYSSIHDPLHPQANDTGRALLEFSKGVALGEHGASWLAVHGANCYGKDKVSFRDRVRWVKENTPDILESADNPHNGDCFWRKADDPYQFLAFCFEWADMVRSGSPKTFISRIPVAFDGSCNAYQHFAAMMQDEDLMRKVNVEYASPVPWDTPSPFTKNPRDLYQEVADVLKKMVNVDAAAGNPHASIWKGKINRKMVKKGVMTKAYGATPWGRIIQLEEELEKLGEEEVLGKPAIVYLEPLLREAIKKSAPAADQAMEQLKDAARQHVRKGLPVTWTTPAGFTVLQDYRNERGKPKLKKHTASISANYVHSLDASHMMITIDRCLKKGIVDFAAIHDSYATHAANAGTLREEITEAFWEQQRSGVYDPERGPILMEGIEWPEVEYEENEPPDIPEGMNPFK